MHNFQEKARFEIPIDMKKSALNQPFKTLSPASEMVVFLNQHIGVEATPIVKEGESVHYGQKIADIADKHICSPIHSPINGKVRTITEKIHPKTGKSGKTIILEVENEQTSPLFQAIDFEKSTKEELLERIQEAGIVGLGGAAFPTHIKLNPPKPVSHLIINAKESDPNVACDFRLMIEQPQAIVKGIQIMAKILDVDDIIFATRTTEDETPALDTALLENGIKISRITPCYSLGSEKLLIKEILGREIPQGHYPFDVGVVVHNIATVYAVWDAVVNGHPLVSRGLTFYSSETGGKNLWVKMGTPVAHILKSLNLDPQHYDRFVFGSIMMGPSSSDISSPTLKATSSITAFSIKDSYEYEESLLCIRCNYCNLVCPVDIYPQMIMEAVKKQDKKWLQKLHVEACIECGLCSYVCPSKINFTSFLLNGKELVHL